MVTPRERAKNLLAEYRQRGLQYLYEGLTDAIELAIQAAILEAAEEAKQKTQRGNLGEFKMSRSTRSTRITRITLLTLLTICARADTVTYQSTVQSFQGPGNFGLPQLFSFSIPQFNPASTPDSLYSVSWTFRDYQQFYAGVNDMGATPGEPYTWTTNEEVTSDLLGLDAAGKQDLSGVTTGSRQISMGGSWYRDQLDAQGMVADADTSQFTGAGNVDIPASSFVWATSPLSLGVFSASGLVQDYATLTVVYQTSDAHSVVPEPAGFAPLLVGLIGVGLLVRRVRVERKWK